MQPDLCPTDDDPWVAERPSAPLPTLDIGTRMTVVRLRDEGFARHSPVASDAPARSAIDAIGPLRAILCANRVHPRFAGAWKRAYRATRLLAAPDLTGKPRDLAFDGVHGGVLESRGRAARARAWAWM